MDQTAEKGICLCGSITLHVNKMNSKIGVCHCGVCRKWSGGPFFAIEFSKDEVQIDDKEKMLGIYNSSEWAERGFCKNCGSKLFYRLKDESIYALSSEIFDRKDLYLEQQVFIDEKPDYYEFANDTKKITGEELFAAHADQD